MSVTSVFISMSITSVFVDLYLFFGLILQLSQPWLGLVLLLVLLLSVMIIVHELPGIVSPIYSDGRPFWYPTLLPPNWHPTLPPTLAPYIVAALLAPYIVAHLLVSFVFSRVCPTTTHLAISPSLPPLRKACYQACVVDSTVFTLPCCQIFSPSFPSSSAPSLLQVSGSFYPSALLSRPASISVGNEEAVLVLYSLPI